MRARRKRERDMVYAYNLPNLGYGYDQYYSSFSSSSSPHYGGGGYDTFQHHHHLFAQLGSSRSSSSGISGQHHNHNHSATTTSRNSGSSGGSMDDPFSKVDVSSHIIAALNSTGKTLPYDVNHDTMFENPDSQCFVKPISEAGVGAMASTFFFTICLFLLSRADRSCFLSSSLFTQQQLCSYSSPRWSSARYRST